MCKIFLDFFWHECWRVVLWNFQNVARYKMEIVGHFTNIRLLPDNVEQNAKILPSITLEWQAIYQIHLKPSIFQCFIPIYYTKLLNVEKVDFLPSYVNIYTCHMISIKHGFHIFSGEKDNCKVTAFSQNGINSPCTRVLLKTDGFCLTFINRYK